MGVVGNYYAEVLCQKKTHCKISFFGMLSGGTVLVLMHYFGSHIGFSPPLNLFNTMISLVLGVPGVILISAVNLLL